MRRSITMLVVLAMLVVAPSANAGKPDKPDRPKPPGQAVLDVSVTANLWSVNIAGDEIEYSIVVTNRGSEDAEVTVADDLLGLNEEFDLPAGESWPLERPFTGTYEVVSIEDLETDTIVNTVVATVVDPADPADPIDIATATAMVEVWPVQVCQWSGNVLSEDSMAGDDAVPCFWTQDTGYWTLTAATAKNKPTRTLLTMRDHFPGNWCSVPDLEPSGAISGMARPGDPLELHVYFPPNGICLSGGAGGEEMGVGTLGTYYLVARGDVTVTRAPTSQ